MGCVSTLRLLLLELPFSKRIWKGDHAKPFDRPCWEANWQRSERQAACDHKHASYDGLYLTVTNIGAGKTTPQSPHLCFQLAWGASHFHSPLATRIPDPQEGDVDFTDVAHGARTIICPRTCPSADGTCGRGASAVERPDLVLSHQATHEVAPSTMDSDLGETRGQLLTGWCQADAARIRSKWANNYIFVSFW